METEKKVSRMLQIWGKEYKKGFSGYFILLLLKERSMYGLEINKRLHEISKSKIVFQESAIYQILKNLKKNGMVSIKWMKSNQGPRRKYYILEAPGEELLNHFTKDYILPLINTSNQLIKNHFPKTKLQ
jgi:DNA-binding PadR family transcriptional regulator